MDYGIATEELVEKIGKVGGLAFLGTKGVSVSEVRNSIQNLNARLEGKGTFGVNVSYIPAQTALEETLIHTLLECGVKTVEASSYYTITLPLATYNYF